MIRFEQLVSDVCTILTERLSNQLSPFPIISKMSVRPLIFADVRMVRITYICVNLYGPCGTSVISRCCFVWYTTMLNSTKNTSPRAIRPKRLRSIYIIAWKISTLVLFQFHQREGKVAHVFVDWYLYRIHLLADDIKRMLGPNSGPSPADLCPLYPKNLMWPPGYSSYSCENKWVRYI